jgi:hypothetical protein
MATDGIKWETSGEAAQAVTAVPGDGLRLVADHLDVHLQGGVAWVEGLGRLTKRRCATPAPARARMQDDPSSCCRTDDESSALSGGVSWRVSRHALQGSTRSARSVVDSKRAFEIIGRDCGGDPGWDCQDVPPRLQRIRGPYWIKTDVTEYQAHLDWHEAQPCTR